ncbi:glycerol kinase GlpK [Jeongeupia naejangsanensis]|uniref:Glycerol kinase n=1 Tax=Jeongeupia naejangsanensis TaxID=613195 RepID=A0ABS2BN46_9NEIS|nr:glycerol kinase GlpK [Jeongeupia naejangsanensis]MBM3116224.1 glycerol kinase GlpK [Jeongeupia naejangsanensis]
MPYLMALDQGTSSSRAVIFNERGEIVASAQREFTQHFPQPGWVEHNPQEIWQSQLQTCREAIAKAGIRAADIAALGITNQRETTLLWDRRTGEPVFNAIVWQDRRTETLCDALREAGLGDAVRSKTGLVIDPYFSATKVRWLLDQVPGVRARAERGELAFGTVDSWLVWKLTGGRLHVTDVTNASRTMLFNIHTQQWDDELLAAFGIPAALLPEVGPSSHVYGKTEPEWFGTPVPIAGIAGDQQSALFGQACFTRGKAKNTYGTGCFILMHTGDAAAESQNGLISTAACSVGSTPQYALEGSVFIGGAVVQWLRDGLKAISSSSDIENLAFSVPDSGGVVFVPSFTGLGAPYWVPTAQGAIVGLSRGTTVAHVARAALESIAFQSNSVLAAMQRDAVSPIAELRVDGGAAANNLLLQFQADLLGIPVVRPKVIESTALGAAYLAGLATGLFVSASDLDAQRQIDRTFMPSISRDEAAQRMAQWEIAVEQAMLPARRAAGTG